MEPNRPLEARSLAQAVVHALGGSYASDFDALRAVASSASHAGVVSRVAMIVDEDGTLRWLGPVSRSSQPESWRSLLDGDRPVVASCLPARPTSLAEVPEDDALGRALRAHGMSSGTIVPSVHGPQVRGALVFGHEQGRLSVDEDTRDQLETIGRYVGATQAMRRLADGGASEQGTSPEVIHAISITGRLASLGTLAGGLVHEVNNPATFIALAAGQIDKLAAKAREADQAAGLEQVVDLAAGIRESTEQIRDMVAAFRLLIGVAHRTTVVTVDLERVLQSAVELTRAAHRHDAPLQTDFEEMPPCPGHYVRLGSVVVNVLVNAFESLRASSGNKLVRVEGRVRDDVIEVRVRDTGEGIAPHVLPRVFEPFFTTRDRTRHAGLGLTIAKEAVEALGGRISIETAEGQGTTVRIDVPATASAPAATEVV